METGEQDLVDRLRRGDPDALDAIYERYRARVFAFAARLSGDRILAEDVLQETFLRLARGARTLEEDTRLRPYLFTLARNLVIDRRRRALFQRGQLRIFGRSALGLGAPPPSPFDLTQATELEARLEAALLTLPARQREAILLVSVSGLSQAEAATVLEVSAETLRKRLSRGRQALARALESQPQPVEAL